MKGIGLLVAAGIAAVACMPRETAAGTGADCAAVKGGVAKDMFVVNVAGKGTDINPGMYGIFFEEINHSGDGGLLAEMVENKSFEDLEMPEGYHAEGDRILPPVQYNHTNGRMVQGNFRWTTETVPGWVLEGDATMSLTKESPMFESAPNSLEIDVNGRAVLTNDGYWGMNFQAGKKYEFRTIVKPCTGCSIVARFVSGDGDVIAEIPVEAADNGQWNDVRAVIVPSGDCSDGRLALVVEGVGDVRFDYVSLMPQERYSYEGGTLPFRKDVAEMLVGLHPSFVRWPGGCVVEGISYNNRYEWKKSLGDPAARPGMYDTWGYHCSYGFGYHEMLCFCESVGAGAMFVCNVGIGCQFRQGDLCSDDEIDFFLDDCLDAIEYALGPVDSEWGALRAQAGHPEPLPLKFVEIGNENWGVEYEKRYNIFHKAIKEKYPELTLICNCGIRGTGTIEDTDMIDPHWYVAPEFFYNNTHLFDNVERGNYTAYVGEYAANSAVGSGNMSAALSEAAWIGSMERNGDFVRMCSYAPLLENSNDRVWPVNLIWVNSSSVLGRSSYYVQQMAAENRPDFNLPCNRYEGAENVVEFGPGKIYLGTNSTVSEFKDLCVTTADGRAVDIDLGSFKAKNGEWSYADGVLRQNSLESLTSCSFDGVYEGNYAIDLKFRRVEGEEGCYVGFAMNDNVSEGFRCSIGGWEDSVSAVELMSGNLAVAILDSALCSIVRTGEWQDVHVDVHGGTCDLFVDGNAVIKSHPYKETATYITAGFDEEASEIVIKIVNRFNSSHPVNIRLEGAGKVVRKGKVITLSAKSLEDENSFDDPTRISPVESVWNGFGKDFTYALAPNSYTILRIRTER